MRRLIAIVGLILLGGCIGTPVPQPPVLAPPDPSGFVYEGAGTSAPIFEGVSGTVVPDADVWIVNLDGLGDPVIVRADSAGGFMSPVEPSPGDELRVQSRRGVDRSPPVDVRAPEGIAIFHPTGACLTLEAEVNLGETGIGTDLPGFLMIDNACGEAVMLEARWRRDPITLVLESTGPQSVPDGGALAIGLRFRPTAAGLVEEILFVEVATPTPDRRPVTVYGSSP